MKKLWKIVGVLVILGIVGGAYGWFFVYNKSHTNYEKAKADFTLDANVCFTQYSDANGESTQYDGKVLQISGTPSSIEDNDSVVVVVFTFNQGMFGDEGVRCTMLPNHNEKALAVNLDKPVTIKGYCPGYNGTDVILEQCSIIN